MISYKKMKTKILNEKFFKHDAVFVAKDLLGKILVRRIGKKETRCLIIETEAYDGFSDKASHASRGKTERNAPMFGPCGYWYVYFTYGIHWMLNIVTSHIDYPSAVLIRGIITEDGKHINGPARLTKFLKIDKKLNGKVADIKNGLWIENGIKIDKSKIKASGRIGVQFAGPYWSGRKWRFFIHI
jgi:DNA-3-methyladenine glycosylase